MPEELIQHVEVDSKIQDLLREAMIKQMEIGYQEMGKLNQEICNEYFTVESQADYTNETLLISK